MLSMKRMFGLAALVLVVLAVALVTTGVAAAQEPPTDPGPGPHGTGLMSQYSEGMHGAIAEALGLTADELYAMRASGQTLAEIAAEQGVELEDVWAAQQAARAEVLAQMVADGVITQEQADWMLERMGSHAAFGMGYGQRMGGGPGYGPCHTGEFDGETVAPRRGLFGGGRGARAGGMMGRGW